MPPVLLLDKKGLYHDKPEVSRSGPTTSLKAGAHGPFKQEIQKARSPPSRCVASITPRNLVTIIIGHRTKYIQRQAGRHRRRHSLGLFPPLYLPFPSLSSTNPPQHRQHFNPVKFSHSLWAQKRPPSLPITTSCQTTPPAKTSTPSTPVPPLHSTHLYPRGLVLASSRPTTSQQASV